MVKVATPLAQPEPRCLHTHELRYNTRAAHSVPPLPEAPGVEAGLGPLVAVVHMDESMDWEQAVYVWPEQVAGRRFTELAIPEAPAESD